MRALALALVLTGCAPGVIIVAYPDGQMACEIKGDPIGQAALEAYYPPLPGPNGACPVDAKAMICARARGGPGSPGFFDMVTAGVGAFFGWLAGR